jgi:hypothetical protein
LSQLKSIDVSNPTDSVQKIEISIIKDENNPIVYTLSNQFITLEANQAISLEINIEIPANLPLKAFESPAYIAKISLTSDSSSLNIPIVLVNTNRITVDLGDYNNYPKDLYLIKKGEGVIDNIWFNAGTIIEHNYIVKNGTYTLILYTNDFMTSKNYMFVEQDISSNQDVKFQPTESLKKVDFNLQTQSGNHLDLNGDLPYPLQVQIKPILPDYLSASGRSVGALPGKPAMQLYMTQPTENLFYDMRVYRFDDKRFSNELALNDRVDINSVSDDKILFTVNTDLLRALNFSYALNTEQLSHYFNMYEWEVSVYPNQHISNGSGTYTLDEDSKTSFAKYAAVVEKNFSTFAYSKAYSSKEFFRQDYGTFRSSEYYINENGDLAFIDPSRLDTSPNNVFENGHDLKVIPLSEGYYDFKLGYQLPAFRAGITVKDSTFLLSHEFAKSKAYFADELLTYYGGSISYAVNGNTALVDNRSMYIADGYWRIDSIQLPDNSNTVQLQFDKYNIDGLPVKLVAELNYNLNSEDFSPPIIKELTMKTLGASHTHMANGNGKIELEFEDESSIVSNVIKIRLTNSEQWIELANNSASKIDAVLTALDYGSYDLQVVAEDSFSNRITYTASPAFIAEQGCRYDLDCNGRWDELEAESFDSDEDGVVDQDDIFPFDVTEYLDSDNDGTGDNADTDDDNDGVVDDMDAFPFDPAESADSDNDGTGNIADSDDDNDGVEDENDAFPYDDTESVDTDGDGIGNNADTDDDNDGTADAADTFPLDPSRGGIKPINNASTSTSGGGSLSLGLLMQLLIWRFLITARSKIRPKVIHN